jgi:predicted double-glycine peptidase
VLMAGLILCSTACAILGWVLDRVAPILARVLGVLFGLSIAGSTYLLRNLEMLPEWLVNRTMAQLQMSWFMPFATGLFAIGLSETFSRRDKGTITTGDAYRSSIMILLAFAVTSATAIFMLQERTALDYIKSELSPVSQVGPNDVIRQSTDYTCGPSACATLLRKSGMAPNASEQRMAELCVTVRRGGSTSLGMAAGIKEVANATGWRVKIVNPELSELSTLRMPYLAATRWQMLFDHAVVVVAYDQKLNAYLIADPLTGTEDWLPAQEFEKRFLRDAVIVYPNYAEN